MGNFIMDDMITCSKHVDIIECAKDAADDKPDSSKNDPMPISCLYRSNAGAFISYNGIGPVVNAFAAAIHTYTQC